MLVKIKVINGIPYIVLPEGIICTNDDLVKEITKKPDFSYSEEVTNKPDFTYFQRIKEDMNLKDVLRELRKRFDDE